MWFFAIAAAVLLLLAVPVTVSFTLKRVDRMEGTVRVHWLFGLVRWVAPLPGKAKRPAARRRSVKTTSRPARLTVGRRVPEIFKHASGRRRIVRALRYVLRAVNIRRVYLRVRIGMGDPADTGRLWALVGPIAGIAANVPGTDLRLEPEFMHAVLEVDGQGEASVVPLRLVCLASVFFLSPETWRNRRRSQ